MSSDQHQSPFEVDDSLQEWQATAQKWLDRNSLENNQAAQKINGVCSGNVVFDSAGKILLLQRAEHDSAPGRWEIPGGAVDDDDNTILHGAARELMEEAGLVARRFNYMVSDEGKQGFQALSIFSNRSALRWFGRVVFVVDVQDTTNVKPDPNEHQAFVWASESEVRDEKTAGHPLPITHPAMKQSILRAFELRSQTSSS